MKAKKRFIKIQMPFKSNKGIAVVMMLILSAMVLAFIGVLLYAITSSTQISGLEKNYKTALEAGFGGTDISFGIIAARSVASIPVGIGFNKTITDACLIEKLNTTTSSTNWSDCTSYIKTTSISIDATDTETYDFRFSLGSSPYPTYTVYSKIVDTVEGNSGADEGLLGKGVVASGSGEVTVVSRPYLYTIEVQAENSSNPSERAKLSILYQY